MKIKSRKPTPKAIREYILQSQAFHCARCSKVVTLSTAHVHHIDGSGHSLTPNNTFSNLIGLCATCHNVIHCKIKVGKVYLCKSFPVDEAYAQWCCYFYKTKSTWPKTIDGYTLVLPRPSLPGPGASPGGT